MSELTDERLEIILGCCPGSLDRVVDDMYEMATEIRRHRTLLAKPFMAFVRELDEHRAMVKRLEKFAADLEGHGLISTGDFIAAELRNRMRTP